VKRGVVAGVVASGAILTVGWLVGSAVAGPVITAQTPGGSSASSSGGSASGGSGGSTSGGSSSGGSTTSGSPAPSAAVDGTYAGQTVSTRFGDVQVEVVISNDTISDVVAMHLTDDGQRSVQISNRAAPVLRQEVLDAQSASVNTVSGATYTSDGYLQSLQSALDQAGF
jgi:uncharacterized protein with FMN-binding domain